MARETTEQKVDRLILTGAVRIISATGRTCVAEVTGDTPDTFGDRPKYRVELDGHKWSCTCPRGCMSSGLCTHGRAAQRVFVMCRRAFEGVTDNGRKHL